MDLSKALQQVGGQLIDLRNQRAGDSFSYPSAIAIVKRDHPLHPFAVSYTHLTLPTIYSV